MKNNIFQNKTIWIIGANSDIAKQLVLHIDKSGCKLKLFSRDTDSLERFVKTNNLYAECISLDITDVRTIKNIIDSSSVPDGLIIAAGYYPGDNCAGDPEQIKKTAAINYVGCVIFLEMIKNKFKNKGGGFISVLSSLGGERGKASNSVYASAKAGLTCYLEGLEQELTPYRVSVSIIKPGWVKTKMTKDYDRVQKSFMSQTPDRAAKKIYDFIKKNRGGVFYTSIWAYGISLIIKLIPGKMYRYLKF